MKFSDLSKEVKKDISKRYLIPSNVESVLVDENNRPYELFGKSKVVLTININSTIDSGFHSGSNRN